MSRIICSTVVSRGLQSSSFRVPAAFSSGRPRPRVFVTIEMKQQGKKSGPAHTFNSDGTRVLDRGVWKRFKYCSYCERIMVERSSWEKNWDSPNSGVKFCSDKCRKASKQLKRYHNGTNNNSNKDKDES